VNYLHVLKDELEVELLKMSEDLRKFVDRNENFMAAFQMDRGGIESLKAAFEDELGQRVEARHQVYLSSFAWMDCQENVRLLRQGNAQLTERLKCGKAQELLVVVRSLTAEIEANRVKIEGLRNQQHNVNRKNMVEDLRGHIEDERSGMGKKVGRFGRSAGMRSRGKSRKARKSG
jgi:hypothetical protein